MKAAKSVRPRTRSERIACEQTPFPLAAGATGNTGSAAQAGVFVTHEDAQRCRSTIAHSEIKVSARSRSATEREPKLVPGDRQEVRPPPAMQDAVCAALSGEPPEALVELRTKVKRKTLLVKEW